MKILPSILLLLLDVLWLKFYMGKQYEIQIRNIQGFPMKTKPLYIVFSYLLMIIGLNLFVLPKIRKGNELIGSLKYGFTFGIVLYGVYDFTAGAVLSKWDPKLAVIDVIWGGFVFFLASYLGSRLINIKK